MIFWMCIIMMILYFLRMYVIIMMTWTCTLNVSRISIIIMIGTGINYVYFDHKNKKEEKKGIRRETRTARRHIWLHHVSLYNEYNNIYIYIYMCSFTYHTCSCISLCHTSHILDCRISSTVTPCHAMSHLIKSRSSQL